MHSCRSDLTQNYFGLFLKLRFIIVILAFFLASCSSSKDSTPPGSAGQSTSLTTSGGSSSQSIQPPALRDPLHSEIVEAHFIKLSKEFNKQSSFEVSPQLHLKAKAQHATFQETLKLLRFSPSDPLSLLSAYIALLLHTTEPTAAALLRFNVYLEFLLEGSSSKDLDQALTMLEQLYKQDGNLTIWEGHIYSSELFKSTPEASEVNTVSSSDFLTLTPLTPVPFETDRSFDAVYNQALNSINRSNKHEKKADQFVEGNTPLHTDKEWERYEEAKNLKASAEDAAYQLLSKQFRSILGDDYTSKLSMFHTNDKTIHGNSFESYLQGLKYFYNETPAVTKKELNDTYLEDLKNNPDILNSKAKLFRYFPVSKAVNELKYFTLELLEQANESDNLTSEILDAFDLLEDLFPYLSLEQQENLAEKIFPFFKKYKITTPLKFFTNTSKKPSEAARMWSNLPQHYEVKSIPERANDYRKSWGGAPLQVGRFTYTVEGIEGEYSLAVNYNSGEYLRQTLFVSLRKSTSLWVPIDLFPSPNGDIIALGRDGLFRFRYTGRIKSFTQDREEIAKALLETYAVCDKKCRETIVQALFFFINSDGNLAKQIDAAHPDLYLRSNPPLTRGPKSEFIFHDASLVRLSRLNAELNHSSFTHDLRHEWTELAFERAHNEQDVIRVLSDKHIHNDADYLSAYEAVYLKWLPLLYKKFDWGNPVNYLSVYHELRLFKFTKIWTELALPNAKDPHEFLFFLQGNHYFQHDVDIIEFEDLILKHLDQYLALNPSVRDYEKIIVRFKRAEKFTEVFMKGISKVIKTPQDFFKYFQLQISWYGIWDPKWFKELAVQNKAYFESLKPNKEQLKAFADHFE